MLQKHRRALTLVLAVLLAVGGWLAVAHSQGTTYSAHICAPNSVPAGAPIMGYVSGGTPPYGLSARCMGGPIAVHDVTAPFIDPYEFIIPTNEAMKGEIVTITVVSSGKNEKVITHNVAIM